MCLLIFKPEGESIPEANLLEGMDSNPHGAGFAIQLPDAAGVYLSKDVWTPKEFLAEYNKALSYFGGAPAACVHFRWSTGGQVNKTNCHPFDVSGAGAPVVRGICDQVLAHNGILRDVKACDNFSDTYHLRGMLARKTTQKSKRRLLRAHTSPGNKFVLLSGSHHEIFGESFGHWAGGVWYSNESYVPNRFMVYRGQRYNLQAWDHWDDDGALVQTFDELDHAFDDIDRATLDGDTDEVLCNVCGKVSARYRLPQSDVVCCWYCRDALAIPAAQHRSSTCKGCGKLESMGVPHFCTDVSPWGSPSGHIKPSRYLLGKPCGGDVRGS